MELRTLAKYFVHGFLYSLISLVFFFAWFFVAVFLVVVGFIIGLIIGLGLLLLIIGFVNGFLGDFLWNIRRSEGFWNTLVHGLVLGILLAIANLVVNTLPTLVSPSLATQVVVFIITAFVDGAVGRSVASWFGSKGGEAWREEAAGVIEAVPQEASFTLPAPKEVSENLPICPLCKTRTEWKAYFKQGLGVKGYEIICSVCHAKWENMPSKVRFIPQRSAPTLSNTGPFEDVFALRTLGESTWAQGLLNKEITITTWKEMIEKFCANCRAPLARNEETCPKCGTRYRPRLLTISSLFSFLDQLLH